MLEKLAVCTFNLLKMQNNKIFKIQLNETKGITGTTFLKACCLKQKYFDASCRLKKPPPKNKTRHNRAGTPPESFLKCKT